MSYTRFKRTFSFGKPNKFSVELAGEPLYELSIRTSENLSSAVELTEDEIDELRAACEMKLQLIEKKAYDESINAMFKDEDEN